MSGPGPGEPQPQQPAPQPPPGPGPAAPPSMPAWTASLTSTAPTPGPAGLFYADVPNRVIAYIIDAIIVGIVVSIVNAILGGAGLAGATVTPGTLNVTINVVGLIISAIIGAAISAAYFVYTWTSMRATIGMRVLGMQIGNAGDGKTLTMDQAVRRWLAIALPGLLAQVLFVLPLIGLLIGLVAFGWFIYLVYSTAKSPTKQGFHDVYANTMVVKAGRIAG